MEAANPSMEGTSINPMATATVISQDNTLTITVKGLHTMQPKERSEVSNYRIKEEEQYRKFFSKDTIMGLSIRLLISAILLMIIQAPGLFTTYTFSSVPCKCEINCTSCFNYLYLLEL